MKQAFIYTRVSTEEQAEEGKSIETQERICRNYAKENDITILEVFKDEGKSATNINRPALKEMLAKCQDENIYAIILQDTDRLARNTSDHFAIKAILKKRNIQLISISQPMINDSPEGTLVDTIIAGVNAFQSQITGRKTSKVLEEKAKQGWYPKGNLPIGYKNSENPSPTSTLDKKIIVIDSSVSKIVIEAFNLYATGKYNISEIAEFLNSKGVKSPLLNKIHPSYVSRMLQDDFYIGNFTWKKKDYMGKHEKLISNDLFERVQMVIQSHNQNATRKRKHQMLLRGYLICSDCKTRMKADYHKKKNGLIYTLYFCPNCRKNSYVACEKLELQVSKIFSKIQITKEYIEYILNLAKQLLEENKINRRAEKSSILQNKSKIEKALREAEDSRFIHHKLSDDAFQSIYIRYKKEIGRLEAQLARVEADNSKNLDLLEKVLLLAGNIGKTYEAASFDIKRNYLGLFIKEFKVSRGKIIKYTLTEDIHPLISEARVHLSPTKHR